MKLKLDAKNPRIIRDEWGNEIFIFTGMHLEDLREILAKVNDFDGCLHYAIALNASKGYYKSKSEI